MNRTILGKSGVEVSALCLGTDSLGSRIPRERSFAILDTFRESGGTFIDTGNFYAAWLPGCSGGESETVIGEWLRERNCRGDMQIATKVGFDYPGCAGGLSASELQRECEKSLRRLGTDHLDLYYAHRDDLAVPQQETMEALERLRTAGKIRAAGASNLRVWRIASADTIAEMNSWSGYCAVQQRHTYLRPRAGADFGPQICAGDELRDFCAATGKTLLAYSVLIQGAYSRSDKPIPAQYAGPEADERLRALSRVAEQIGASVNQVILAWMLADKPAVLPIIAASSPDQLRETIAAANIQLSPEQMRELNEAGNPKIAQAWLR